VSEVVLVLNGDGNAEDPLTLVTVKHAIRMLCRNVAVIVEAVPDRLIGVFPWPRVVQLNQRKGPQTLAEAGMTLRFKPTVPSWAVLARR
jgi:hypothetical protein